MKIELNSLLGFNLRQKLSVMRGLRWYFSDLLKIRKQLKQQSDFQISSLYPILSDKFDQAGVMKGHYFHQDLLVAKKIYQNAPKKHVDIGSRIDGFVAHVAIFREIEIFDIRNMESNVENKDPCQECRRVFLAMLFAFSQFKLKTVALLAQAR